MAQTTTPTVKPSRPNPPALPEPQHDGNGHGESHAGEGIPHEQGIFVRALRAVE